MATGFMYDKLLAAQLEGLDWINDSIKCMLVSSAYTANVAHTNISQVSANEVSGTGYIAGGQSLAGKSITPGSQTRAYANDIVWDATGGDLLAAGAVVYKDTGVEATSPLLFWIDFQTTEEAIDGTFSIFWNANGILLNTEGGGVA